MTDLIIKIVAVLILVAFIAAAMAVSVAVQYVCVNHYAPWILGTDDKQAIAFFCKPTGGK